MALRFAAACNGPWWCPVLAVVFLALAWFRHHWGALAVVAAALVGGIVAAVHHAEVAAHKVGEPFGSLILAVAVTVIEVGHDRHADNERRRGARQPCARHRLRGCDDHAQRKRRQLAAGRLTQAQLGLVQRFQDRLGVATVIALTGVTMVLPSFTTSAAGREISPSQLAFAAVASLVLYAAFVFTQTVRHRDFFLPVSSDDQGRSTGVLDLDGDGHADPPKTREAWLSLALLVAALVSVVGLAKLLSPTIEEVVRDLGFPYGVVGVVIALLVLTPESIAAVRNARQDRVQISLNLAYRSAMASIGLTIPTIAVAMIWLTGPLELGLEPTHMILLAITVAVRCSRWSRVGPTRCGDWFTWYCWPPSCSSQPSRRGGNRHPPTHPAASARVVQMSGAVPAWIPCSHEALYVWVLRVSRPSGGSDDVAAPKGSRDEPELEEAYERLVSQGHERLDRPLLPLVSTGLLGGVDVGVGVLMYLVVEAETGNSLLASMAFTIGFVALLLANSELFTENFLVPVISVIAKEGTLAQLVRLWVVTLAANLVAGFGMAGMIVVAFPDVHAVAVEAGSHFAHLGVSWRSFFLAVLAGAVITLLTRMQNATENLGVRVVAAALMSFVLVGAQLFHSVLDSILMFVGLLTGDADYDYVDWSGALGWSTFGNLVGGLVLVTGIRLLRVPHRVAESREQGQTG